MYLSEILKAITYEKSILYRELQITGLSIDSKHILKGDLYIAFQGNKHDGHLYAEEAVTNGAVAIVCERILPLEVPQIIVKDARAIANFLPAIFYGHPEEKLKIIGVTGTNGKTTTIHMLASILQAAGKNVATVGTLGIKYNHVEIAPDLTTPDPIFLFKNLKDFVAAGVEYVVMEVSAHAIHYQKVIHIPFEVAIFTNCTPDHLDFFENMEVYKRAKERFFSNYNCKYRVLNVDDSLGLEMSKKYENVTRYALDTDTDAFAIHIDEGLDGSSFLASYAGAFLDVKLQLIGRHNVYNALSAICCAKLLQIEDKHIIQGLESLQHVEGRLQHIARYKNADIFIDFAHTPDGLEKSLATLRRYCTGRLIVLFGCGGNRDRQKRPIMGEIAAKIADFTIITSDNPRYEEPMDIIEEIEKGFQTISDNYVAIEDRKRAIAYGLDMLQEGDILIVAGKGAECYQEKMGIKHYFSDQTTVLTLIDAIRE